jgi:hypothetical protein
VIQCIKLLYLTYSSLQNRLKGEGCHSSETFFRPYVRIEFLPI